jgi:hypothetical protein
VSSRAGLLTTLLAVALTLTGTPAEAATDSDGDGLRDTFENRWGVTSAHDPDTDGDGVVDPAEDTDGDRLSNRGEQKFGSHPGRRDSDGDGVPDGKEDADRDGRSNATEQDHRAVPAGLQPGLSSAAADVSPHKAGCQATAGSSTLVTCDHGPPDSAVSIVLMGDSHAMQLATPLVAVAEAHGWRLTTLVKKACPPVLGIHNRSQRWLDDGASCRRWRRDALAWLNEEPPDHIILAHSDAYAISTFDGRPIIGDRRATTWFEGMKRTLRRMPASSEVLLLGDIPYNRVNPVRCLQRHPSNISKCVTSRQPLRKRRIERALERAATARGARFRRFYGKVCSYDPCPVIQGEVLMYRDRGHLTATFAARLTPTFESMMSAIVEPVGGAGSRG